MTGKILLTGVSQKAKDIYLDKDGIPLFTVITSTNIHDVTIAIDTVDSIVIKRPSSSSKPKYNY